MKKFIIALIITLASTASSFAVSSDDIYVRKDVFDVHLQNINKNLENILAELKAQRNDINELAKATAVLSARIDGIDNRVSDLRNDIYLGLVILGIILGLPNFQKFFQWREAHKSTLSLQDVERLIDSKLNSKAHS